ncbi:hypothetical protein OXX69_006888 [Metschnikowia pulcherrima]
MISEPQIADNDSESSRNVHERRHRKHNSHRKISKHSSKGRRRRECGNYIKNVFKTVNSKHLTINSSGADFSPSSSQKEKEHVGATVLEHVNDSSPDEVGTASYRDRSIDEKILALSRLRDEIRYENEARAFDESRIPTHSSPEYIQSGRQFANHRLSGQENEDHGERMILDQEAPMQFGTLFERMQSQGLTNPRGNLPGPFSEEPSSESDTEEIYSADESIPQHGKLNASHSAEKSKPVSFTGEASASRVKAPIKFSFTSMRGNRGTALPPERILRSNTIAKTSSAKPNIASSEHSSGLYQTASNSGPKKCLLPLTNPISPFRSSSAQVNIDRSHEFPRSISYLRNLAPVSITPDSGPGPRFAGQRLLTSPEQDGAQGLLAMRNGQSRLNEITDQCAELSSIDELREIDQNEESEDSGQPLFCPVNDDRSAPAPALALAKLENQQTRQDQSLLQPTLSRHSFGPDERCYPCPQCPRIFPRRSTFQEHLLVHREKPLKCDDCGNVYKSQTALTTHKRAFASDPRFKCETCKRKFSYKGAYKKHLKKHIHLEPHQCKLCDFSTRKSDEFIHHMTRHRIGA